MADPVPDVDRDDRPVARPAAWGRGRVVVGTGAGETAPARVDFGSGGTKRLVLRYAPLVKL